ncbi:MAG TPA: hypothetical protein VGD07_02800 [Methylomirabilota bacterium]
MKHAHELGHRLAALRADFTALGTRAAGAAAGLTATLPPPSSLLEELTAARAAFADLRAAMIAHAGELSLVLDDEGLGTLRDLEPVLSAITAAEERRVRVAAWEQARDEARRVLDRVLALIHRDEKNSSALADCQGRARELHAALAGPVPDDLERASDELPGKLRPHADLLALIDGWNVLDDDRCAVLQDAITEAFGRTLGLAALRGKLGHEAEAPPPAPAPPPPAAEPVAFAISQVAAPAASSAPEVAPRLVDPPAAPAVSAPVAPSPAAMPAAGDGLVVDVGAGAGGAVTGPGGEAAGGSLGPTARREREELLEQLAQETARWWIAAREGWNSLRERGLGVADAAPDYLRRFPHLLSVPLQQSAEADGRLAEGYALLLAHIEKQEEGFVPEALTRLNPQFTTRARDQSYSLGQELYLYVVAEGRLYKTYPDFVREIILHTVPEPGPWVQGGIVESDDETRLFTRAATPGSIAEQTRTVTDVKERLGPHVFTATLGPLTTRFFTLRLTGPTLADPPAVEIKLKDSDAPSDHAWLVTLPGPGKAQPLAPRKHRTGGTTLPELGKEFTGLWLAIFNPDPTNDHRYDLSIILRRRPPPAPPPAAKPQTPAPPKFFGRKR